MNYEFVTQGFVAGMTIGVTIIVLGWIGHSVFFGVNKITDETDRWQD